MKEDKMIKRQLLKSMIFTFITFSIIFTVFDLIIYNQISSSIYKSIDKEIETAQVDTSSHLFQIDKEDTSTNQDGEAKAPPETNGEEKVNIKDNGVSPRLIYIVRDSNGDILNKNSIGRFYDDYINDISFDKDFLNESYTININGSYFYRGMNFTVTKSDGEVVYVQVLANVDGEVQTVKNTIKTLITTTIIMVALSIVASYIVSKRTLRPIIESWHRQTEFVQNASHELRTPLTIIQAKQELLLQEPNKKIIDKSKDITVCLNETRRLSKLVKELMALARADSNKMEINRENTNIDEMIKEVSQPYIEMAKMQNKKVNLKLNYKKQANIDRNKIAELLIIVLDNAIKYTSKGEDITIETQPKDGKVLIEVSDTGIGISKDGLKHIFERFYREDKARSRETGGNGLGLAIAQTIVTAHNGTIRIVKNEPKGTKVIIKI